MWDLIINMCIGIASLFHSCNKFSQQDFTETCSHLFQEDVLEGDHAHSMMLFTFSLTQEPAKTFIGTLRVCGQTVPQTVHLF